MHSIFYFVSTVRFSRFNFISFLLAIFIRFARKQSKTHTQRKMNKIAKSLFAQGINTFQKYFVLCVTKQILAQHKFSTILSTFLRDTCAHWNLLKLENIHKKRLKIRHSNKHQQFSLVSFFYGKTAKDIKWSNLYKIKYKNKRKKIFREAIYLINFACMKHNKKITEKNEKNDWNDRWRRIQSSLTELWGWKWRWI